MIVKIKKFANYSKKLKVLRSMEEMYNNDIQSVILYDTIEKCKDACNNRNEWNPAEWIPVEVNIQYEVPNE